MPYCHAHIIYVCTNIIIIIVILFQWFTGERVCILIEAAVAQQQAGQNFHFAAH